MTFSKSYILFFHIDLMGNIYNRLSQRNAPIAKWPTCCKILVRHQAIRISWSTKFPLGGGSKTPSSSWPIDLWNLVLYLELIVSLGLIYHSLGLTYQVRIMTLASTVLKKSTFNFFPI